MNKIDKKKIKNILLKTIIITLIIEILIFNLTTFISFFRTIGKQQKEYDVKDLSFFVGEDERTVFEIRDINTEISTVRVIFANEIENPIDYNLAYSDDTSEELRYLNQSKVYVPIWERTEYMDTYFSGNVKSLDVNVDVNSEEYDVIQKVIINEVIPLDIIFPRMIVIFLVALIVTFIKKDDTFCKMYNKKDFKQEVIIMMTLYIVFFMLFVLLFMITSSKGSELELYTKQFIDALNNGQVHLDIEVSEKLLELENPYDQVTRDLSLEREVDYRWDTAYYKGKYYTYFGIFPAITLLLPFYKLTGLYMTSSVAVLVYEFLILILLKLLLEKIINILFKDKEIEFKVVFLLHAVLYFGTLLFYLMGIPRMYELVIIAGVYAVLQSIWFLFKTFEKEKVNYFYLCLASIFMAGAIAARPTQIFMSVIIAIVGIYLLIKLIKEKNVKDIIKLILSIGIPYIVIAILLMTYNYVRFENPFEFGASYQLTVNNMDTLNVGLSAGIKATLVNLFNIPTFTMDFPFLLNNSNVIAHYGYYYYESLIAGMFFVVPLLFIIFDIVGFNKNKKIDKKVKITVDILLVLACIITFVTSLMGGCIGRYLVDSMWIFVIVSEIMYLAKYVALENKESKDIYKKILSVITVYVIVFALLSGIVSEKSRFYENSPNEYFALKYMISFWQ